ncbi:hypothetical protein NDU88_007403 [Pleurodeles waltl]|uniref:Uncharacterized protein n=1 Tax=Pleurodeles waltl TaxID=8319 RepID=A0AAV7QNN3_PLEWA|nr:hypothetical protein NDU88_007403 [Pleurodeles waltl]
MERRTSELDDVHHSSTERLLQMERILEVIKNKNEDPEACSQKNNIRILGVPQSTAMGRMEDFVEDLLKALLSPGF